MKVYLLLLLLNLVSADRLRYHLENLIDKNVSACDDFYHHACSQSVDPKEFFHARVTTIFREAKQRLLPGAIKNSPIEYDLNFARSYEYNLKDNDYKKIAKDMCKKNISCFYDDQTYYQSAIATINLQLMRVGREGTLGIKEPKLTNANSSKLLNSLIKNYISDTSVMIDQLARFMNTTAGHYAKIDDAQRFHRGLQTRFAMNEFMKANSTYNDFHEIKNISRLMKHGMIEYIEKSKWLHGDEISEFIGQKIQERVKSIEVFHDFDEFDRNSSVLQRLNRDLNHIYFTQKRNTGIRGLDIIIALANAYEEILLNSENEVYFLIQRILYNFDTNAFFLDNREMKAITVLAPYMYRPLHDSKILKEPIIMYTTIGHELYHSLFDKLSRTLRALYSHRGECVMNHYRDACKFVEGECYSGKHTFSEDGADLEGLRLTYDILKQKYSEQLNEQIDGLQTTLEQAFFYYAASEFCSKTKVRPAEFDPDVHSAKNIRVNAAFSLMPEFSRAFQCKEGDRMYIEEEKSCYIFGPKAKR